MEYYHVRTGYDFDRQNAEEQALYQWYCNWLNGMDFEHMSEMDRAKEIQKVIATKKYEVTDGRNSNYYVLIEGKGNCADYAGVVLSLSNALGLECIISGSGNHASYYVYIDGEKYGGQNQHLDLIAPAREDYRWNGAQ